MWMFSDKSKEPICDLSSLGNRQRVGIVLMDFSVLSSHNFAGIVSFLRSFGPQVSKLFRSRLNGERTLLSFNFVRKWDCSRIHKDIFRGGDFISMFPLTKLRTAVIEQAKATSSLAGNVFQLEDWAYNFVFRSNPA